MAGQATCLERTNDSTNSAPGRITGILLERADMTGQVSDQFKGPSRQKPSVFTQTPWATHQVF